jgi:hypothetical protein
VACHVNYFSRADAPTPSAADGYGRPSGGHTYPATGVSSLNLLLLIGRSVRTGGLPFGHGARCRERSHLPITALRNSVHERQNDAESRTVATEFPSSTITT